MADPTADHLADHARSAWQPGRRLQLDWYRRPDAYCSKHTATDASMVAPGFPPRRRPTRYGTF